MRIELPWPPTANNLFPTGKSQRRHLSVRGRKYRKAVWDCLREQHGVYDKLTGSLSITTEFSPPDRRRRDEDNYHKAIRDSFTWAKLIADDCQFKESHNYWRDPVKGGRAVVTIEPLGVIS